MKIIDLGRLRELIDIDGDHAAAVLWIRDDTIPGPIHEWIVTLGYRNHCWTEHYSPESRPQCVTDAVGAWEETRR